jgi:hypothetical protein
MDVKDQLNMMPFIAPGTVIGNRLDYIQLLLVDLKARQAENRLLLEDMKNALEYGVFSKIGLTKCTSTPAQIMLGTACWYTCGDSRNMYSIGVNQNIAFTATTHDIATSSSIREKCYLVEVTSNGTITVSASAAAASGLASWPDRTATKTAIGGVRIGVNASAGTIFDASTTTLTASQLAHVTFYDWSFFDQLTNLTTAITAETPASFSAEPTGIGYV